MNQKSSQSDNRKARIDAVTTKMNTAYKEAADTTVSSLARGTKNQGIRVELLLVLLVLQESPPAAAKRADSGRNVRRHSPEIG